MRYRLTAVLAVVILPALAVELSAQTRPAPSAKGVTASRGWVPPKTPWGDPDLQGTWTSDDCIGTPMQRPANLGDRPYLTEQELAQRESQLARQAENDKQESVAANARV